MLAYFGEVEARSDFVYVLELDVVRGLRFHVGDAAWKGQDTVGLVKGRDGVCDEPEVCGL